MTRWLLATKLTIITYHVIIKNTAPFQRYHQRKGVRLWTSLAHYNIGDIVNSYIFIYNKSILVSSSAMYLKAISFAI